MAPTQLDLAESHDLTDSQVDDLLKRAEERLRDPGGLALQAQDSQQFARSRKLETSGLPKPYIETNGDIAHADPRRLVENTTRVQANGSRKVEDPLTTKKRKLEAKKATAGTSWYNMPRTELTPALKRDLDLLHMRSVLDTKRFYKRENTKRGYPEFSQVGQVIEGPTDYYSGRIPKKQRKRTLAEEVMEGERETGKFKSQYEDVQKKRTSGKKSDFKNRMKKRYGKKYNG